MADNVSNGSGFEQNSDTHSSNDDNNVNNSETNLANFILQHYDQQKESSPPGDQIDNERMERFLSKALSESNRMNNEVLKCKNKTAAMQQEFGADLMSSWRQEHASQVLSPEQAQRVEDTYNSR